MAKKINFKSESGSVTSELGNTATTTREYDFPDKSIVVADDADIAGVSESYTATITFDLRKKYSSTTQTGAIAIALAGSGHINNSEYRLVIDGNGSNTLTISSAFNVFGVLDNSKRNILYLRYISSTVKPIAIIYTEPLVTFVNEYSLSIAVATPDNSASLSDSGATLDFTNGSGTDVAGSFFAWIKLNAVGISQCIMSRGDAGSNAYIQFNIGTDNKLVVYMAVNGSNYIGKQQTTATLVTGIWTRVGFTKSTAEAHTGIILYVNGLAVALTNVSAGSYTGVTAGGTTKIGHQNVSAGVTGNFLVDDASFYNVELTAAQVLEDYNGGFCHDKRTTSFAANLISYHSFEQNGTDLTGNGHTATITTAVYNSAHP